MTLAPEHPEAGEAAGGPQRVAVEVQPGLSHTTYAGGRRVGGDPGGVEGADRAPDHHVGGDARFEERLQHPHLDCAQIPATPEHKRGARGGLPQQPDGHLHYPPARWSARGRPHTMARAGHLPVRR